MNEPDNKKDWPQMEGMETTPPRRECAAPAQPPPPPPDPHLYEDVMAATAANREARLAAQARGGPLLETRMVMAAGMEPAPEVPGYGRPCRMTLAMRQIMMVWARLPAGDQWPDLTCLLFCFLSPRRAWAMLTHFDTANLRWVDESAGHRWRKEVMDLSLTLTENGEALQEALAAWVNQRVQDFFASPEVTPPAPGTDSRPPSPPPPGPGAAAPAGGSAPGMTSPLPGAEGTWSAPSGTMT